MGKNLAIERVRALAILAVVSIHTVNSAIIYKGTDYAVGLVVLFSIIKNLLYWAVPCFGMISGFLLLNPAKEITIKKIICKYIFRIALVLILFGTIFSTIEITFQQRTFSLLYIFDAIIKVLTNNTWAHLWYLYALISVYILLPLYRKVSETNNDKYLMILSSLVLIIMLTTKSRIVSLHFYFIFGEILRREIITIKKEQRTPILVISCVLISGLTAISVYGKNVPTLLGGGYTSILTIIQSYCIFNWIYMDYKPENILFYHSSQYRKIANQQKVRSNTSNPKYEARIEKLAKYSFGIYLSHMVFVNLEFQFLKLHLLNSISAIPVIFLLILINTLAAGVCSYLFTKVPILNKIV